MVHEAIVRVWLEFGKRFLGVESVQAPEVGPIPGPVPSAAYRVSTPSGTIIEAAAVMLVYPCDSEPARCFVAQTVPSVFYDADEDDGA
jgi:hypothetical protein